MFIQKLEIYSALLNQATKDLVVAIENVDIAEIKRLTAEIENAAANVAKYSEKVQKEAERAISKIESGVLKKVIKKDNSANKNRIDRMESIINETKELIVDTVVNKTDNTDKIETLNNEYFQLTSSSNGNGWNVCLQCENKSNNKWHFVGHNPIATLNLNEMTLKKTSKGMYIYRSEKERYALD